VTIDQGSFPSAEGTGGSPLARASAPLGMIVTAIGLMAGTWMLCWSFSVAATQTPSQLEFTLFWLGELVGVLPIAVRLTLATVSRSERLALVTAAGLFAFIPMFLRDPTAPLFFDALIHWHQAQTIAQVGHPFVSNSLTPIIRSYPGLEELTASLRNLTGLSTFEVGTAFLWLLHIVSLVGVFVLVELITRSSRAAGLAALFYSVSPAFMFFDSQFSYESLAIVFAIWVLVCVAGMQTSIASPRQRRTWFVLASVVGASCIVTHHVTTYALIVALLAVSIATLLFRGQDVDAARRSRLTLTFTALFASGAAAWLVLVAPGTVGYLAPHIGPDIRDLLDVLSHKIAAPVYFTSDAEPKYEQIAAAATIGLLIALTVVALKSVKRFRTLSPVLIGLVAYGMLYFLSVPFMLSSQGEAVIRSWGNTYMGLAALIALLALFVLPRFDGALLKRVGSIVLTSAIFIVVMVGNVHVQVNAAYRFPGPYIYGSDTRSLTPELLATADWLRSTAGPNQNIVADRDTGIAIGTYGDESVASASPRFPVWDLYFSTGLPPKRLIRELRTSAYHYLVVETEMYQSLPLIGYYFTPQETKYGSRTKPPPQAALAKFGKLPWLTEIFSTQHYRIYRMDFSQVNACPAKPFLATSLLSGCRSSQ